MTIDFRALCAELLDHAKRAQSVAAQDLWFGDEDNGLFDRADAALADESAAPELKAPTDEELKKLLYFEFTTSTGHGERVDEIGFARAVLARWGNPAPAPPADGEVAELVAWLRRIGPCNDEEAANLNRAAELLERQALVPVSVSERLPGDELCWWYEPDEDDDPTGYGGNWTLLRIRGSVSFYTHWLPAHALPLPEASE